MSAVTDNTMRELTPAELELARLVINDVIAHGPTPGVHIEWLSCFDIDAPHDAPPHEPGRRQFRITQEPTETIPWIVETVITAIEPRSDRLHILPGDLLGNVYNLESGTGEIANVAEDMATPRSRAALMKYEGKSTADLLHRYEVFANDRLDDLRALAANPKNWSPISATAWLFGVYGFYALKGGAK